MGDDERQAVLNLAATLDSAPKNAIEPLPATNSKASLTSQRRRQSHCSIFLRLAVKGKPPAAVAGLSGSESKSISGGICEEFGGFWTYSSHLRKLYVGTLILSV